jgi:hypothetical protein
MTPAFACLSTASDEAAHSSERLRSSTQSSMETPRLPPLYDLVPLLGEEGMRTRLRRGEGTPQQRAVFHEPEAMNDDEPDALAHLSLAMIYNPNLNGLEDQPDLSLRVGSLIAGRYRVAASIGRGSFSKVYLCHDGHCRHAHG